MGSRWGQDGDKIVQDEDGVKGQDWDKEQDINGHKDKWHIGERMLTRWIHDGGKGQDEEMIRTRVKMVRSWGWGTRWGQDDCHRQTEIGRNTVAFETLNWSFSKSAQQEVSPSSKKTTEML